MQILKTLIAGAAALTATTAFAAPLTSSQILSQFNAVVSDNFSTASDVEGRLVTTNLNQGATFYNNPRGTASAFGAVNAINIGNFTGNVNNGGAVDYQNSNAAHFNMNGGGTISHTPAFAMSDFTTPLNALSAQLSGMTANSTINAADPNNFSFNVHADAGGTAVFTLTAAQLSTAANLNFVGSANTIIINVTGASYNSNANFNDNSNLKNHLIWNFADATELSFRTWNGAILAGNATVATGSPLQGFLYAKDFTGNGELHDYRFDGVLPTSPVPEPSGYAMLGAGLVGIVLARRRRRAAPFRTGV